MAPPRQVPPPFVRLAAHPLRWALLGALAAGDHRVRELTARLDEPQNLVSYHLRLLREAGLVTARRSSADARDTYYHLDLDRCATALADTAAALHPALAPPAPPAPAGVSVLFACTGNTARSPVAAAVLRHRTGGAVTVTSAGSDPGRRVHPAAVRVLRDEFGVDLAGHRPRHLDTLAGRRFDYVVTVCDRVREVCPGFGGTAVHWSVPDPAGARDVAAVAADLDTRVRHLLPVLAGTP